MGVTSSFLLSPRAAAHGQGMKRTTLYLLLDQTAPGTGGDLTRLMAKAVPAHLLPKKIVTKGGVTRTYYVKPYSAERSRRAAKDTKTILDAARTVKAWSENPIADQLTPQDHKALIFLQGVEARANDDMTYADWKDPVGIGPREIRSVTNKKVLADIQARLDEGSHEMRVELLAAYELHYDHPGFDRAAREVGNVTHLYHGVNSDRAAAVIATGLKSPKAVGSTSGQMFGPGIYFADDAGKSAQYIGAGGYSRNSSTGILLECDVALGQMYGATESMEGLNEDGLPIDDYGDLIPLSNRARWISQLDSDVDLNELYDETDWSDVDAAVEFLYHAGRIYDPSEITFAYLDGADVAHAAFQEAVKEYDSYDDDEEGEKSKEIIEAYAAQVAPDELNWNVIYKSDGMEVERGPESGPTFGRFTDWAEAAGYSDDEIAVAEADMEYLEKDWHYRLTQALYEAWRESEYPAKFEEEMRPEEEDAPERYHSVHGLKHEDGGSLKHNEFIVYDPDQVKIRRVLMVRRHRAE